MFALFCLIALITSIQLRSISSRLKTDLTIEEKTLTLLKWQHFLICRAVEKMNQNFGFTLLLEVIFCFVATTNNLMFTLASGSEKDWHLTVSSTFFCWTRFFNYSPCLSRPIGLSLKYVVILFININVNLFILIPHRTKQRKGYLFLMQKDNLERFPA